MTGQHAQLLLTNDDGIDAPGLAALELAVAAWGQEVIVVAPEVCHSGGGHRVTTHRPLVVQTVGPGRFCIDGTPADCTRLALSTLCPDPTWVLSGINAGGNLGVDVHLSGTVAAAREAALHGRRSLAVSQYRGRSAAIDWERASRWVARVLARIDRVALEPGEFWNANLPDPATVPEGHAGGDLLRRQHLAVALPGRVKAFGWLRVIAGHPKAQGSPVWPNTTPSWPLLCIRAARICAQQANWREDSQSLGDQRSILLVLAACLFENRPSLLQGVVCLGR